MQNEGFPHGIFGYSYPSSSLFTVLTTPRGHQQLATPGGLAFRRAVVAVLLAHLLAVIAMTAFPKLHQWVHQDADGNNHDCAVTLFLHGGYESAATVVILIGSLVFTRSRCELPRTSWVPGLFLSQGVLEYAPPFSGEACRRLSSR